MFLDLQLIIASDHAGQALKEHLIKHFIEVEQQCIDLGVHEPYRSVDYPDYAHAVCHYMQQPRERQLGILICGTGIGMSIVANRYPHIRCAVALTPEMAQLARSHNDANVIALGARLLDQADALAIVESFIETEYEGGRHDLRLMKINPMIQPQA